MEDSRWMRNVRVRSGSPCRERRLERRTRVVYCVESVESCVVERGLRVGMLGIGDGYGGVHRWDVKR